MIENNLKRVYIVRTVGLDMCNNDIVGVYNNLNSAFETFISQCKIFNSEIANKKNEDAALLNKIVFNLQNTTGSSDYYIEGKNEKYNVYCYSNINRVKEFTDRELNCEILKFSVYPSYSDLDDWYVIILESYTINK